MHPTARANRTAVFASTVACRPLSISDTVACETFASNVLADCASSRIERHFASRDALSRSPNGVGVASFGRLRAVTFAMWRAYDRSARLPTQPLAVRLATMSNQAHGSPEELFWSHVEKTDGGCWPWHGASLRGYGKFNSRSLGRQGYSHRWAYEFTRGPIPDGLHVLHRCDNPPCCNPDHLFLGTHLDNVADMNAKGRGAHGDRHGSRTHPERLPRGENHKRAKLTAAQVEEIRSAPRKRGEQRVFARRFGVSEATVSMIVNGKVWLPAP